MSIRQANCPFHCSLHAIVVYSIDTKYLHVPSSWLCCEKLVIAAGRNCMVCFDQKDSHNLKVWLKSDSTCVILQPIVWWAGWAMWNALLLLTSLTLGTASGQSRNFTVYSAPIKLRYGEVYNYMQGPLKLPEDVVSRYAGDKDMAVTGFDVEMVRQKADGSETLVKLNDHYLHHYILSMGHIETMNPGKKRTRMMQGMKTLCDVNVKLPHWISIACHLNLSDLETSRFPVTKEQSASSCGRRQDVCSNAWKLSWYDSGSNSCLFDISWRQWGPGHFW